MIHDKSKKYVGLVLALVGASVVLLASYTFINDPYWIWQRSPEWSIKWQGHNRILDNKMRYAKSLQVVTRQPREIILGSSRVYRGIEPPSPEVYNMGISALRIKEANALLGHTIRWTNPDKIIVGLDYFMFDHVKPFEAGYDPAVGSFQYLFRVLPGTLVSKMAYKDVQRALEGKLRGDGHWTYAGFKQTNPRDRDGVMRIWESFFNEPQQITDEEYQLLREMVGRVVSADIELYVYISPSNSCQIGRMHQYGEYSRFVQWRNQVESILAEFKVELHDFSEDNPYYSQCSLDGSTPTWIDSSHYSPIVGEWILAQVSTDD